MSAEMAHLSLANRFWNQDNGKEQNRQVLASLSRKCDERKANAQRIDDKQHREKCKEKARFVWSLIRHLYSPGMRASAYQLYTFAYGLFFHARAPCRDAWNGLGMVEASKR